MKSKHLHVKVDHIYLTSGDLCRYHVCLVALLYQVLLNDTQELTYVWIALGHVLESLQAVDLDQLLLQHLKLFKLLSGHS